MPSSHHDEQDRAGVSLGQGAQGALLGGVATTARGDPKADPGDPEVDRA